MGDKLLAAISNDLVKAIRSSVTIDWNQRESVRAAIRSKLKRLLRQQRYPPDKQEGAVVRVIYHADKVCAEQAWRPKPATCRHAYRAAAARAAPTE